MNTNSETNNTGAVVNTAAVNNTPKRRGRPIDMSKTRKVFLVKNGDSYIPRGKGAPTVGKESFFVLVQRNQKNKDFVFNSSMEVHTEIVAPRVYKARTDKVETVTPVSPITTIHESANGAQVTQIGDDVVVENPSTIAAAAT